MMKVFLKHTLVFCLALVLSSGLFAQSTPCTPVPAGTDLTDPVNLTQAFNYMQCAANCTYTSKLLKSTLGGIIGSRNELILDNVTFPYPFQVSRNMLGVDMSVSGTAQVNAQQVGLTSPGDVNISTCAGIPGKTVTFAGNVLSGTVVVNTSPNVGAELLGQSWLGLVSGNLGLQATIGFTASTDITVNEDGNGKVTVSANILPGDVHLTGHLGCTNNLGLTFTVARVADALSEFFSVVIGIGPELLPIALGSFEVAATVFVQGPTICSQATNAFNEFLTGQFVAGELNQKIATAFGSKLCSVAGFGLSCSSIQ